ncbi:hypothetical protein [Stenoxybacter acetivorans]|uniref:hypothetical protein n=1 Tax=Stenoxybacter acetivorans TaxID=422441 RepID=UPI0006906F55|nr:hypothetical protein [Stenoxybacter acetivorans]
MSVIRCFLLLCLAFGAANLAAQPVYICRLSTGKAVFTSYPQGKCELSVMDGVDEETEAINDDDALMQLIYEKEFGNINENAIKLPPPSVYIKKPLPPAHALPPAPVIKQSPKQLVERDMQLEEAALKQARQNLANAKARGNAQEINRWQQIVTDREQNIRALQREWEKY